jgi:hypothetical protein
MKRTALALTLILALLASIIAGMQMGSNVLLVVQAANNADVRIEEFSLDKTVIASNENATISVRLRNYANLDGHAGWGVTCPPGFSYSSFNVDGWEWIDQIRFVSGETKAVTLKITNTGNLLEDKTVTLQLVVISGTEVKQDFNITFKKGLSLPTPSAPEFTVELADHSYDIPTTYSTDPYTGENVTHPGYRVDNKTIDITIKNQPFVAPSNLTNIYYDINLYYNIRVKGHFEENWTDLYYISNNTPQNSLPRQSASENTVILILQDYSAGDQVDFQAEAVIATAHQFFSSSFGYWSWETSGWSNTQTITIPAPATSPIIQLLAIIGIAITVVLVGAALLVYFMRRKQNTYGNSTHANAHTL